MILISATVLLLVQVSGEHAKPHTREPSTLKELVERWQANYDRFQNARIKYRLLQRRFANSGKDALNGKWRKDPFATVVNVTWTRSGENQRFDIVEKGLSATGGGQPFTLEEYRIKRGPVMLQKGAGFLTLYHPNEDLSHFHTPFNPAYLRTFPEIVGKSERRSIPVTYKGIEIVGGDRFAVVEVIETGGRLERRYFATDKGYVLVRTEVYQSDTPEAPNFVPLPSPIMVCQALELKEFENGGWLVLLARHYQEDRSAFGGECIVESVDLDYRPDADLFSLAPTALHSFSHGIDETHYRTLERVSLSDFNADGTVKESSRHLVPASSVFRWNALVWRQWLRERWPFSLFVNHPILASLTVAAVVLGPVAALFLCRRRGKREPLRL